MQFTKNLKPLLSFLLNLSLDHDAEQARFITKTLELFTKNGMHLDPDNRQKLMDIRKQIFTLSDQFCTNINEDSSTIKVRVKCNALTL